MTSIEEEMKEKIYVIVRLRPLRTEEATARSPWKLSSKSIASNRTCRSSIPTHTYTFDKTYGAKTSTLDIYNGHIKDMIATTMSGINGTVIAYGQSGSGKTYTLLGSAEESGILMLAVQDMFQIIQEASNREFLVRMSYLEVANEKLNDLLAAKSHKLEIRDDVELGVVIGGLREEIVDKSEQIFSLLEFAKARRATDSTDATNHGVSHTIFRLVIESRNVDRKNDLFNTHERDAHQISVLTLVEVASIAKVICGKNDTKSQNTMQLDKCLMALQSLISNLSEGVANKGDCVPDSESRLTHILRQSLGGNARTCFICNISPALVHMDETIQVLNFAAKSTKVINYFKVNEVYTNKALLKRQRKEIEELLNKLKKLHSPDLGEQILNRRNALLMIDLEKEQMCLEVLEKTPSSSQGENKEQGQEQRAENIIMEGESEFHKSFDTPLNDFSDSIQKRNCTDYLQVGSTQAQELQELDLELPCLGPSTGIKRKRSSFTTEVANKVDFLFQSKVARDDNWLKYQSLVDKREHTQMQTLIVQGQNDEQDIQTKIDEHCKKLQCRIIELEAEKVLMEKRLFEQEVSHNKKVKALQYELVLEKSKKNKVEVAKKRVLEASKYRASTEHEVQHDISQERQEDIEGPIVKQSTETQSCTSQEMEDQQKVSKEKESQNTSSKKKPSKVNKVYVSGTSISKVRERYQVFQKLQGFQGRSEMSNLRNELVVASETITALEDERNDLWKDLNQMKLKCIEIQNKLEVQLIEEDCKGEHNFHQLLVSAVDMLKLEVESTASMTNGLLGLLFESFQILAADLKSFQEGVAEIKVLNNATTDTSKSFEYAKMQLLALRHEKFASEKELNSMKSELAKLECVVERQSGVLKVLSDNENLLNELALVREAMKEAAGASELQVSSIQQEYETKLKELESNCEHWRQEYLQLEEKQTRLQDKLSTTEEEVMRLTQALDEKSKQDKKPVKYIKARLAEAESKLVLLNDQLREKLLSEENQKKIQEDLAESRNEVEKLKKEVEEKSRLKNEHNLVLTKLAKSEDVISKLTTVCEEHEKVDLEQKNVKLKLESEIINLTKLLEEKSGVEQQQKKIQIDLATLQEKIDNIIEEAQQKDVLDKKQCELLLRLENAEKDVTRLTELLKNTKDQSEICLGEMMKRFQISEAEVVTLSESLQREVEERLRLEGEHRKDVNEIEKLEDEKRKLAESFKWTTQAKEEEHIKDCELIASLKTKIKELTQSLSSMMESKEVTENENMTRLDTIVKLEAELKRWTTSHHQEVEQREKLEKELNQNCDYNVSLEADVKNLAETIQRLSEEKDKLEKEYQKDLELIIGSELKIKSMTEKLQQCFEEKVTLERELRKALEEVAIKETMISKLTARLHTEKEETMNLEEKLRKDLDDLNHYESRVTLLVEHLDHELEEKKKLEKKLEEITEKLDFSEKEVATFTKNLTQVTEEKCRLESNHSEMLDTCTLLWLEISRLSESMKREIEVPGKFWRKTSQIFDKSSRLIQTKDRKRKRNFLKLEHDTHGDRNFTSQDGPVQQREVLAKELEIKQKLENDHAEVLHQLITECRKETTCLGESVNEGAENSRSLMTNHSHTLSLNSTPKMDIDRVISKKSGLEEELPKIQLVLASSEAQVVRLNSELIVKCNMETELQGTQTQLAKVTKEVTKWHDEKCRLEKKQVEIFDRSTSPIVESMSLTDDFVERTTIAEELQTVRSELIKSKVELASMRISLREKLGLEETLIKTQIELVNKQGEYEKLIKELRINRKMVKEQKKLLRKLTSTQSEVSRLKTAVEATSEDQRINTQTIEMTDGIMIGLTYTPDVNQDSDKEQTILLEKLTDIETENIRLTRMLDEKKTLEADHARVQLQLVKAENEIQRLAATMVEFSKLNHLWETFGAKISDSAIPGWGNKTNSPQLLLEDFLTQLLERENKLKEKETELESKVAFFEDRVNLVEKNNNSKNYFKCVECDVFKTLVEQIQKERDELRALYTTVQTKLQTLKHDLENQKRGMEVVERNWRTKCQKSEKELVNIRLKFGKLEEEIERIIQEKKALEERLSCNEEQIATWRESSRAKSKELEMIHRQLHIVQTQHQSDVAALYGELSVKTARTLELEKELKTLLNHPPPPPPTTPIMQNEFANYITSQFIPQSWSYPAPLQPPEQRSHLHESHWGGAPYKGQHR